MGHRGWIGVNLMYIAVVFSFRASATAEAGDPGGWHEAPRDKTRFSAAEKEYLEDAHNHYRRCVSPAATDMRQMYWDSVLEKFAATHVRRCTGTSFDSTGTKLEGWDLGQNIFITPGTAYSLKEVVRSWWNEKMNYEFKGNKCSTEPCEHYKTLVANNASRLGCAMQVCNKLSKVDVDIPVRVIVVSCLTDHTYNPRDTPYTAGIRGADCGKNGLQNTSTGLCASGTESERNLTTGSCGGMKIQALEQTVIKIGTDTVVVTKRASTGSRPGQTWKDLTLLMTSALTFLNAL